LLGTVEESKRFQSKISLSKDAASQTFTCQVSSIDQSEEEVFESGAVCIVQDVVAKLLWDKANESILHQIEIDYVWPLNQAEVPETKFKCNHLGCDNEFTEEELSNHRKVCQQRKVRCTHPHCHNEVKVQDLIEHLSSVHKENLDPFKNYLQSGYKISPNNFRKSASWMHRLIEVGDEKFLACFVRSHETSMWYYWVYVMGTEEDAEKFEFKIR
jgi:hypothetical protein